MSFDILERTISCDGEIGLDVAMASLPTADRAHVQLLTEHADVVTVAGQPASRPGGTGNDGTIVVGHDARTFRPRIANAALPPGNVEVLRLRVPAAVLRRYHLRYAALAARQAAGVRAARTWLEVRTPDEIRTRLARLTRFLAHVGPFIVFVEERTYTNVYDPPNLTGGAVLPGSPRCALTRLSDRRPADWSDDEVRLFYGLTHVASVGEPTHLNEISFRQVGYWEVRQHLLDAISRWTGCRVADDSASPTDKLLRRAGDARRSQLDRLRKVPYRTIHGRTFTKVEHAMERGPDRPRPTHRPVIEATAPKDRGLAAVTALRRALDRILASTDSDYAMSRGVRDFDAFTRLLAVRDYQTLIDWEPQHYFCFVVARRRPTGGESILRSISERMRYNCWHFLPDCLSAFDVQVPASRDYFFAPVVPDLSFHEDRVYAGHIRARVKFAIRVPKPISVLGRPLPGLADLRLARTDGPRYTVADLRAALPLADEIAEIHQTMADLRLAVPEGVREYDRYDDDS